MLKKTTAIILSTILIFISFSSATYGKEYTKNPPREVLEKKIEEVAKRRGIPTVILKAVARVESVYKQFKPDGSVYTGPKGSIGLMQINNRSGSYSTHKLKYDIDYNINIAADILLQKWKSYGQIGDMNPNVLENWYFALWAYNGWASSNNPNTGKKKYTYQELIYMMAEQEYGQPITLIDPSSLPQEGVPSKKIYVDSPQTTHTGDIEVFLEGDIVLVDATKQLVLRDNPGGSKIKELANGTTLEVLEGPILKDRFFWYKVKDAENEFEGWAAMNWITRIGSKYPFNDIGGTWAQDYIVELYNMGIITGDSICNFNPDSLLSREELYVLLSRALEFEQTDYELPYVDSGSISEWAVEHIKTLSKANIIVANQEDNTFRPQENLTREEVAVIISKALKEKLKDKEIEQSEQEVTLDNNELETKEESNTESKENSQEDTEKSKEEVLSIEEMQQSYYGYKDIDKISSWALDYVKFVKEHGLMEGSNDIFNPKDYLTRAQASKIIVRLLDIIDEKESIE